MKRYLFGLIGLAAFGASSLIGQTLAFGGECCAPGRMLSRSGLQHRLQRRLQRRLQECDHYCPRCGCRLEPVCHPTCDDEKGNGFTSTAAPARTSAFPASPASASAASAVRIAGPAAADARADALRVQRLRPVQ